MSTAILLLLMSPFLLLVLMFSLVVIVALCQAKPDDVPAVLRECGLVFRRLVDRVPSPRGLPNMTRQAGSDLHNGQNDSSTGEAP